MSNSIDCPGTGSNSNERITDEVLERYRKTADPRLCELLLSLVKHLHAVVSETGLTQSEWQQAIDFLVVAADTNSPVREEFVALSDVLGLSTLVIAQSQPTPPGATLPTLLGPFYLDNPAELPNGSDISNGAVGRPLYVSGRVATTGGNPIAQATIDVWHTDEAGLYDVQGDMAKTGMHGRARLQSQADGRYSFWSVVPVGYPVPDDGAIGLIQANTTRSLYRPAHMHYHVQARGFRRLVTQAFVRGCPYLDDDAGFGVRPGLVFDYPRHKAGIAPDGKQMNTAYHTLEFDIVLVESKIN